METTRDREIRIATEGLRLAQECKMPRFCSSAASSHVVDQWQQEWSKLLPPLLDWTEQHRHLLLDVKRRPAATVQAFQGRFVLVFLEMHMGFKNRLIVDVPEPQRRLFEFYDDVHRIIETNATIRSWLFHYYGSELGLQGWQCRPGDLYGFYCLMGFPSHLKLTVLFGQQMVLFAENIGKELLGFSQNQEFQKIGIHLLTTVMEVTHMNQQYTDDPDKLLKMALQLNEIQSIRNDDYDSLADIVYYCVSSICNAGKNGNSALGDEVMLYLLAELDELLVKKADDPNFPFDNGQLAYLRAVTQLLLLDVPDADVKDFCFDQLTISGRVCEEDEFRQHVKFHTEDSRFSIRIRLRIAKMIPKLFAGFTSTYYVEYQAYRCLEFLTWMTMFPASKIKQQRYARGLMLKRLVEEIRRLLDAFIKDPSQYSYDVDDLNALYGCSDGLLSIVVEAIEELPNAGWFRRYKLDMQSRIAALALMLEVLKCIADKALYRDRRETKIPYKMFNFSRARKMQVV